MFGFGKNNLNPSFIPVYLFVLILITNQFICIHSLVLSDSDRNQNLLENIRENAIRRLAIKSANMLDDSSSADNDLQLFIEPTIQRRFCCMSPLSGRKRFIRDLARQQLSNIVNQ